MKKVLIILGGGFLGVLALLVIGITVITLRGNVFDKESKQYADTIIPAVISDWDPKELKGRASPELRRAVGSEEELEKLFATFKRLGHLREYKGATGQSTTSVTIEHGMVVTAAYTANAEFDNGPADIQLVLIKRDDQWQVLKFQVHSDLFLKPG